MLPQVHALLVSGGLNAALPGVLMRSQSASAMMQHQLAPLAARQAAMLNKVRRAGTSASVLHQPHALSELPLTANAEDEAIMAAALPRHLVSCSQIHNSPFHCRLLSCIIERVFATHRWGPPA